MKHFFHPSWMVTILEVVIIILAVVLAAFGVVKDESKETLVLFDGATEWFGERLEQTIDAEVVGLGEGYLLGAKDHLSSELKDKIKVVGMSHIIVVSGTHLAIIIGWAKKIFGKISRLAGFYFALTLLVAYIGVVGLTPSLFRAGLVAILTLIAWYFGRKFEPWRIILTVMAITLLIDPSYILNMSWQLSMSAYAGILLLLPELTKFFYSPREKPKLIGQMLLSSLAAVLMCLPLTLYYFGSVSLLSFVANLLILPTIPLAMGLTFLAGLLGGGCFNIAGIGAELVLKYHTGLIKWLGEHEEFLITIPNKNPMVFVIYGVIAGWLLVAAIRKHQKRRKRLERCFSDRVECRGSPQQSPQQESSL